MDAPVQTVPRHFLGLLDLSAAELRRILDMSAAMKKARVKGVASPARPLAGKTLAMVFDRPSTRTRVSFDVAMRELGGETIMLIGAEMQLGRGEKIADTARVLSRYVEAIVIRILAEADMLEMAAHAAVPVINGLTKQSHPCQVLADILTFEEKRGPIRGRKIAWSGDYNNVLSSWIDASARFGFALDIACPRELRPTEQRLAAARAAGADIVLRDDPLESAKDAAAVISDCWVSMGDEDEGRRRGGEPGARPEGGARGVLGSVAVTVAERPVSSEAVDDIVLLFAVESLSTRGRLVRMGPAIDQLLKRHDYPDRKSTRLNSSHHSISYAVFCL